MFAALHVDGEALGMPVVAASRMSWPSFAVVVVERAAV